MKIVGFHAEGFKRIKLIDIKPTGRLVQITGKNGSGKTSCLDAILVAIKGMAAFRGQSEPINIDANTAMIKLDLGEMVVTRVFRRPKEGSKNQEITTEVRVENKDGFRAPEPQKMLDKLVAPLTLDPLEFSRMDDKGQRDTFRRLVSGFDFDLNTKARKQAYDLRTEVNRQARDADGAVSAVKLPDDIGADAQPIDEAALADKLADAGRANGDIEARKARREAAQQRLTTLAQAIADTKDGLEARLTQANAEADREVSDIEQQIAALQVRLTSAENERERKLRTVRDDNAALVANAEIEAQKIRAALDAAPPLPKPVDVQAVLADLNDARRVNASLRVRQDHAAKVAKAEALHADADALTAKIEALDKEKADAIAAAKLPVPGLTIGEDGILLDGLPFSQASDAQRLRTSCAIAMALNSELRVLRVRDGSLLDDEGLALLEEMAAEHDYDIWLEAVSTTGNTGIVLEDGMVKSTPESRSEERQGELV